VTNPDGGKITETLVRLAKGKLDMPDEKEKKFRLKFIQSILQSGLS
jgi:hypothetical protein